MRVTVAAVGRLKNGPERDLFDRYARMIRWPLEVREVEERQKLSGTELKAREAEKLLAARPEGAILVALDEGGEAATSETLARKIGAWQDDGIRDIVFAIGGAEGLAPLVKRKADWVLAFGSVTWPH